MATCSNDEVSNELAPDTVGRRQDPSSADDDPPAVVVAMPLDTNGPREFTLVGAVSAHDPRLAIAHLLAATGRRAAVVGRNTILALSGRRRGGRREERAQLVLFVGQGLMQVVDGRREG